MKTSLLGLALLGCVLLSSCPALAATELSREQITVTAGQNTITVDTNIRYGTYAAGESITVTLGYSAACNLVFNELTLRVPSPFSPYPAVTGEITNVSGTPTEGYGTNSGSVTFDLRFDTLYAAPAATTSARSGQVRLNLALGVDKDCNLATGGSDGVDGIVTIRVQISVSTVSQNTPSSN